MPNNYVPALLFALIALLIPLGTLLLFRLVRPSRPFPAKAMPYECGIDPVGGARHRFSVRYYLIAILFVLFDVETVFLFPWAIQFKHLGLFGLGEMLVFLGMLLLGYVWLVQSGALEFA